MNPVATARVPPPSTDARWAADDDVRVVQLGVDVRTASVDVLQRAHEALGDVPALLRAARGGAIAELALLVTCNRVEFYAALESDASVSDLTRATAPLLSRAAGEDVEIGVREDEDAVRHLVAVAAGLESALVGEQEILNQVRRAYGVARGAGTVGVVLHRLFQRGIHFARVVRAQLDVEPASRSLTDVAAGWLRERASEVPIESAGVVGAGEIARRALLHLARLGARELLVVNRDVGKGGRIATEGASVHPLTSLADLLPRLDVVVFATASPTPILDARMLEQLRVGERRELTLVDFGVPRNVDGAAASRRGVRLLTMADIVDLALADSGGRQSWTEKVAPVLTEAADEFVRWQRGRRVGRLISDVQAGFEETIRTEARALSTMGGHRVDTREVDRLATRLSRKLLHRTVKGLQDIAVAESPERAEELATSLFLSRGSS